jgi:hypothetical protein
MAALLSKTLLDEMTDKANEALHLEIRDALINVIKLRKLIKEASLIADQLAMVTDHVIPYEECHRLICKAKIELADATETMTNLIWAYSTIPRIEITQD